MTEIHLPDRAPHQPFTVQDGIHVLPLRTPTLPPATHTNCIVLGEKKVVVVDPASPYSDEQERLLSWLRDTNREVLAIWLTHHHFDHIGGANALREATGAPILAHPLTAERLDGQVRIDEALYEGDCGQLGHLEFEVLHTPGHARGHLAFREKQSRTLIAGDLVAGQGTIIIDPPEGNMVDYLLTLARLVQQGIGNVIPAHGPLIDDGEAELLRYIAHRKDREDQVIEGLQRSAEQKARPIDLVAGIYPEVPPIFHPLAERQLLAHLLKLVEEGRVGRSDDSQHVPGTPVYMSTGAPSSFVDVEFKWLQ